MFLADIEAVEHLLNICSYFYRFFAETNEDSQEYVIQNRVAQQDVIKRDAFVFGAGVKYFSYLAWFTWMIDPKD